MANNVEVTRDDNGIWTVTYANGDSLRLDEVDFMDNSAIAASSNKGNWCQRTHNGPRCIHCGYCEQCCACKYCENCQEIHIYCVHCGHYTPCVESE